MEASNVVAIVGPTASGKSAAAMQVATKYNGEIICADSRTIYRSANVGTAKPDENDQKLVRHWGLDLVEPGETFSAHQFKLYCEKAVQDIISRGKLPIIVGGTGLYVDAYLYNFEFRERGSAALRERLEKLSVQELQEIIRNRDLPMPTNALNPRHLIRTIETDGIKPARQELKLGTMYIGINPEDSVLQERISRRIDTMFNQNGLLNEVRSLVSLYGEEATKSCGIGYLIAVDYLNGVIDIDEAKRLFCTGDWQYARRQRTWFKKNKDIIWFASSTEAAEYICKKLHQK